MGRGFHLLLRKQMSNVLRQGLHSFKRQIVMETSKQSHFLRFKGQTDSKDTYNDPSRTLWQVKVNKQVTPNSKSSHDTNAIISQLIDLIKAADYFWKLSG